MVIHTFCLSYSSALRASCGPTSGVSSFSTSSSSMPCCLGRTLSRSTSCSPRLRKLDLSSARENISHDYPMTNPNACRNSNLFLLALVFSSTANVTQRDAVRKTWANQTLIQGFPVRILFFLGSTDTFVAQKALAIESDRHGDMAQGHAVADSSLRGPTEMTVSALRWVIAFCPVARFVLLTKDSVFVNLPAIGGYLLGLHRHPEDFYLGRVIQRESPDRDPKSPGYLPPALYPDKYLPEYCDGMAYVLSQDVVRKVYVASAAVRAPVRPDVFVGLCAQKAGVTPKHSSRFSGEKHIPIKQFLHHHITAANHSLKNPHTVPSTGILSKNSSLTSSIFCTAAF
uniref:Hexosyltransferase n=1 Tax=Gasterosteus aculeatus aculeatus TaxID=481459 RepID=A0AAQ4QQ39_GASAC